jgi:hypothetical protein
MRSRANKTGRTAKPPRHVRLYHAIMKTAAFKDLSPDAVRVYIDMAMRYGGPGSNNGRIHYSAREAGSVLHKGKTTGAAKLKELQEHGFIVSIVCGGFNRKDRHATEWRLTEFDCDITRQPASRDFDNWRPEIQNTVHPGGLTVRPTEPNGAPRRTEAA